MNQDVLERTPEQVSAALDALKDIASSKCWLWVDGWLFQSPRSGKIYDMSATDPDLFDWEHK